jgi:hypothetical protein
MSFFSSSQYKPQIRQEGFSPTPATNTHTNGGGSPPSESIDSPTLNNNSPGGVGSGGAGGGGFNDLFSHSFLERWVPNCFVGSEPILIYYLSSICTSSFIQRRRVCVYVTLEPPTLVLAPEIKR